MDLERGSRILRILDDAGLQVKVAMWAVLGEYEDLASSLILLANSMRRGQPGDMGSSTIRWMPLALR
jgi:hypothetical protein